MTSIARGNDETTTVAQIRAFSPDVRASLAEPATEYARAAL